MSAGQRRRLPTPESEIHQLYEARGESRSALEAYKALKKKDDGSDYATTHNIALLSYLADTSRKSNEQAYLCALKDLHSKYSRPGYSTDMAKYELVLSYNLALASFSTRDFQGAEEILYPLVEKLDKTEDSWKNTVHGDILCKIAFLCADCLMEMFDYEDVENILNWIEKYIKNLVESDRHHHSDEQDTPGEESLSELKFRLHCYRARYHFICAERENDNFDLHTKKARKELKNANEIFNHQLSGKKHHSDSLGDGTGSIQDSVAISVDSGLGNGTSNDHRHNNVAVISNSNGFANGHDASEDNRPLFERRKSDHQYQHALYLKAKLELLKKNEKKSIKLCHEAKMTGERNSGEDDDSIKNAIYSHNMATVHQASGEYYIALNHYANALSALEQSSTESSHYKGCQLHEDGTIHQISVSQVLYNAALCAQKCGNYLSSCECMLQYLEMTDCGDRHPFPWLHLGESCIGIYTSMKQGKDSWGLLSKNQDNPLVGQSLQKATSYLTRGIVLCVDHPHIPEQYKPILEALRVTLAFVWMEMKNYSSVVTLAESVLAEDLPGDDTLKVTSKRLRTIMRIYASEAMAYMGTPDLAFEKFLPDDIDDDAADFLEDDDTSRLDLKNLMTDCREKLNATSKELCRGGYNKF